MTFIADAFSGDSIYSTCLKYISVDRIHVSFFSRCQIQEKLFKEIDSRPAIKSTQQKSMGYIPCSLIYMYECILIP